MASIFQNIMALFGKRDKWAALILIALMILAACMEMIGLTLLVPIIDIVSDASKLNTNDHYQKIYDVIGATSVESFIIKFSIIVIIYILLKNAFLTFVSLRQANFIKSREISITNRLLQSYLMKPYIDISHRNSADMIRNINQEVNHVFVMVVNTLLTVVAELFVVIALLTLMIFVSPGATLLAFGLLSIGIIIFIFGIRKIIQKLGNQRQNARGRMIEWATQALYSLKELLVAEKQHYFLNKFRNNSNLTRQAEVFDLALSRIPQLFIETFAIITLLSVMLYTYMQGHDFIATLSVFALVLLRLMPTMNRIIICISRAKFYLPSLNIVVHDLENINDGDQKIDSNHSKIQFNNQITIKDISFAYPSNGKIILQGVNLKIQKGDIISIVGESGSGKTTFMDIMLGLLSPQSGSITVDNMDITSSPNQFLSIVSYLPQSVYLLNTTIRENIAFGVEPDDIDDSKINSVIEKVGLSKMISELSDGLDAHIGDIGGKVSGGQRQRIGIARALYHDKDVLFLDEATAGLDSETENKICETLKSLTPDVTIISI